jgi:hypothetical protein
LITYRDSGSSSTYHRDGWFQFQRPAIRLRRGWQPLRLLLGPGALPLLSTALLELRQKRPSRGETAAARRVPEPHAEIAGMTVQVAATGGGS